jgi:hypothetical protein
LSLLKVLKAIMDNENIGFESGSQLISQHEKVTVFVVECVTKNF